MLLTKRDDVDITGDTLSYERFDSSGNPAFKAETTVSTGYTDISSLKNWDAYWWGTTYKYKDFRDLIIADHRPDWATLSDDDKKTLVRNNGWPDSETEANLDLLYTSAERDIFTDQCLASLDAGDDLYAYDTTTQAITTANTHQDLDFDTNALTSSWTHVEGQAEFTCQKTGRYLCIVEVYMQKTTSGPKTGNMIALFDGVEIAGS